MKSRTRMIAVVACILGLPLVLTAVRAQDKQPESPTGGNMAAMMEKMQKYMKPGEHHKVLEKFLGKWDTEFRMHMGGQPSNPEKGTCETTWLVPGKFVHAKSKGSMMGMPVETFSIMGYDNFKMSYVTTFVNSMETAIRNSEGDMDPSGKLLITYGTLDEYLTGENDKMVKYVWRFESDDEIVMEIHDLPIGEKNTKVVEITYTRSK